MISAKSALLLLVLWASASHAATYYDKLPAAIKRAVDNYNYPLPIITFQENPKKTLVESFQSVSPPSGQGRYLPPGPTASSATGQKSPPVSVSFNAYEPSGAAAPQAKPAATAAPAAPAPATAAPSQGTNTAQRKRPTGGLGGFKYYGGSGASSSSSSSSSSDAKAAPASTSAPAAPAPASAKPVVIEPTGEKPKSAPKAGYDYPSPKSNRKPSKKEQKLADSKPEESAQGYHYDVGPGAFASSGVQTFSAGSSGSSGGMMGLSYMRQSSPYYSYHVMLD